MPPADPAAVAKEINSFEQEDQDTQVSVAMAIFLGVMRSPGGAKRVWVALLSLLAALRALASRNGSRCADLAFFYNEVSLYRGRQLMRGKGRH